MFKRREAAHGKMLLPFLNRASMPMGKGSFWSLVVSGQPLPSTELSLMHQLPRNRR